MSSTLSVFPQVLLRSSNGYCSNHNGYEVDEFFKEVVFLASPAFCQALEKSNNGLGKDKIINSKKKYFNRYNYRCTPFGLFAGVGIVSWTALLKPIIKIPSFYLRLSRTHVPFFTQLVSARM